MDKMVVHTNEDLISKVDSASKAELTSILFQGCINFINAGESFLRKKKFEEANIYL